MTSLHLCISYCDSTHQIFWFGSLSCRYAFCSCLIQVICFVNPYISRGQNYPLPFFRLVLVDSLSYFAITFLMAFLSERSSRTTFTQVLDRILVSKIILWFAIHAAYMHRVPPFVVQVVSGHLSRQKRMNLSDLAVQPSN